MKYCEAVNYINNIPKFTKKNSLEHTKKLLEAMGIHQEKFKIIHVAGTNGKGSVCTLLSNILVSINKKTGLFTSPHLVDINERIKINNIQVTDEEFMRGFDKTYEVIKSLTCDDFTHPSFFEFLFIMSMYIFKLMNVEYIVLETGLGGRLDATNSIDNPILTIITSIGLDHTEYLGNTLEKIAWEKAGIIKKNIPIIYFDSNELSSNVIEKVAAEKLSRSISVKRSQYKILKKTNKSVDFYSLCGYYLKETFTIPYIAEYQIDNTMLVLSAVIYLNEKFSTNEKQFISIEKLKYNILNTRFEGRMEEISNGVFLDGAHNEPGIKEFVKTFNNYPAAGKKSILFSVVSDKDFDSMVCAICNTKVDTIYITHINSSRGLDMKSIEDHIKKYSKDIKVVVISDVSQAYEAAIENKAENDILFCVGSLYLIGEIKSYLRRKG